MKTVQKLGWHLLCFYRPQKHGGLLASGGILPQPQKEPRPQTSSLQRGEGAQACVSAAPCAALARAARQTRAAGAPAVLPPERGREALPGRHLQTQLGAGQEAPDGASLPSVHTGVFRASILCAGAAPLCAHLGTRVRETQAVRGSGPLTTTAPHGVLSFVQ